MSKITRLDYCQFLLSSQINYTLTYFAEHTERFSHDAANRYLRGEKITAQMVWENVREQVKPSAHGYLLFDDTVLDHNHSFEIELVRRQYSGNAIFSSNGSVAYQGDYANPSTVAQLNQLVMYRSDGSTTIKAPAPANIAPTSAPTVAALLMIPPTVLQGGAPGETLPRNSGPVSVLRETLLRAKVYR